MRDTSRSMTDWARGRTWWVRAPVLLWVGWMAVSAIRDPEYESVVRGFNFGVHEFGHILFSPFGEFMAIAGGSITQLAVPIVFGAILLWTQRDWFAVVVCGFGCRVVATLLVIACVILALRLFYLMATLPPEAQSA